MHVTRNECYELLKITIGSILFAAAINLFITPLTLFPGGMIGTAYLIKIMLPFELSGIDLLGIINLLLNIPIFLLASQNLKRKTLYRTIYSVILQSIVLSFLIAPTTPILDDLIMNLAVGGILAGFGCGIVLSAKASAGGLDLLGLYLSRKYPGMSVGRINIYYNAFLYSTFALLFNVQTSLYSIVYVAIVSLTTDRFHYQNIPMTLMIFTQNTQVKEHILKTYVRGVTVWHGFGAYTKKDTEILLTVVSKSEVGVVKKDITTMDKNAFIIELPYSKITGGYQIRLD